MSPLLTVGCRQHHDVSSHFVRAIARITARLTWSEEPQGRVAHALPCPPPSVPSVSESRSFRLRAPGMWSADKDSDFAAVTGRATVGDRGEPRNSVGDGESFAAC